MFVLYSFAPLQTNAIEISFSVEDVNIPNDGCEVFAQLGDHVLIEFEILFQNGTVGNSVKRPEQLFYFQIDGSEDNINKAVRGMCLGATRKISWPAASLANLFPIFAHRAQSMYTSIEDESLTAVITMDSITTVDDYAIFDAIKADNSSKVLELIDQHKGVNAIDKWGQTPLMIATIQQRYTELAALLNTRRPSVQINAAKPSGATALIYAVQHAQPMIAQALLRRGADPNMSMKAVSSQGNTPLHFACLLEKQKHAELLLEYGANPNALNQYGQSPLQLLPETATRSTKLYFKKMFEDAQRKWSAVAIDGDAPKAPIPFIHDL